MTLYNFYHLDSFCFPVRTNAVYFVQIRILIVEHYRDPVFNFMEPPLRLYYPSFLRFIRRNLRVFPCQHCPRRSRL